MPLTEKQGQFVDAVQRAEHKYYLYGGGFAGGKTLLVLGYIDEMAMLYPGTTYAVIRKSKTVLRRNTIPSFEEVRKLNGDKSRCEFHGTEFAYNYRNGSKILLLDADITKDRELNNIKGLQVTGAVLEEANEVVQEVFNVMMGRVGRWMNREYGINPFILLTCNPSNSWVKWLFYDPWKEGKLYSINNPRLEDDVYRDFYFLEALPKDNPYLSPAYLEGLGNLPEAEYNRYVLGDWDFGEEKNQLVKYINLKEIYVDYDTIALENPRYMAIDVAREGNDKTVVCMMSDNAITGFVNIEGKKGFEQAVEVKRLMREYGIADYCISVDGIGPGASLIDDLEKEGIYVNIFKSSDNPEGMMPHFVFMNKKAEAYWMGAEDIRLRNIVMESNKEFQKQALQILYNSDDKCISMEKKSLLKSRTGFSPDYWDSYIMCNFLRNKLSHGGDFGEVSKYFFDATPTMASSVINDLVY